MTCFWQKLQGTVQQCEAPLAEKLYVFDIDSVLVSGDLGTTWIRYMYPTGYTMPGGMEPTLLGNGIVYIPVEGPVGGEFGLPSKSRLIGLYDNLQAYDGGYGTENILGMAVYQNSIVSLANKSSEGFTTAYGWTDNGGVTLNQTTDSTYDICSFNYGNGIFLAVGRWPSVAFGSTAVGSVAKSDDGKTWQSLNSYAVGTRLPTFLKYVYDRWVIQTVGYLSTSIDNGVSWSTKSSFKNAMRDATYNALHGVYLAVGENCYLLMSDDGGAIWSYPVGGDQPMMFMAATASDTAYGVVTVGDRTIAIGKYASGDTFMTEFVEPGLLWTDPVTISTHAPLGKTMCKVRYG